MLHRDHCIVFQNHFYSKIRFVIKIKMICTICTIELNLFVCTVQFVYKVIPIGLFFYYLFLYILLLHSYKVSIFLFPYIVHQNFFVMGLAVFTWWHQLKCETQILKYTATIAVELISNRWTIRLVKRKRSSLGETRRRKPAKLRYWYLTCIVYCIHLFTAPGLAWTWWIAPSWNHWRVWFCFRNVCGNNAMWCRRSHWRAVV